MKYPHYKVTETAGGVFSVSIFFSRNCSYAGGDYASLEVAKEQAKLRIEHFIKTEKESKIVKEYHFEA